MQLYSWKESPGLDITNELAAQGLWQGRLCTGAKLSVLKVQPPDAKAVYSTSFCILDYALGASCVIYSVLYQPLFTLGAVITFGDEVRLIWVCTLLSIAIRAGPYLSSEIPLVGG